ncbi:uncharacterized protein I303_102538 [Kwoniella dejecticola CBS 10117]|uniref:Spindle pole body component n=1 Tax=Kwoniella dejecticola CBS 10117 TaxID=1296121 RepID=A0A1A6A910_9TREE|nr:uncharacterized protein I303_02552 [Kwoniella dejecticola CBS 10117]OBR86544.1 hypothetical protein I303_02552 [Kwoniella dejecticola CBS 10117]
MAESTLTELSRQLVSALIPELSDNRIASKSANYTAHVVKSIKDDTRGGQRKEWQDVRDALVGLSQTAKIRVQHDLADALEKNFEVLERCRRTGKGVWTGEGELDIRNLPQYVHLLLDLSQRPTTSTHDFAHSYLNRVPHSGSTPDQILFEQIMEEEPFDPGEVWDEEVHSGWSSSDEESEIVAASEGSESPAEEDIRTPSSAVLRAQRKREEEVRRKSTEEERRETALEVVRGLKDQYWNTPGDLRELDAGIYGWKDLITQGCTASLASKLSKNTLGSRKAITSVQLQREILFALSGKAGIVFEFSSDGACGIIPDHPLVEHLSARSLDDLLEFFRSIASQAAAVRVFSDDILQPKSYNSNGQNDSRPHRNSRTQQAFAEASQRYITDFDRWLAELEASFTLGNCPASSSSHSSGTSAASTPSVLRLELQTRYAHALELLSSLIPHSADSTVLLNLLFSTTRSHSETKDETLLLELGEFFVKTAKPLWDMLGEWLQHGMPIPSALTGPEEIQTTSVDEGIERALEEEFFIKHDRDVSWADEDFYECGFVVSDNGWPDWIGDDLGEHILEAGKARGLLRSLMNRAEIIEHWPDLGEILNIAKDKVEIQTEESRSVSQIEITDHLSNYIKPICQITQFQLRKVLDEECGLEEHLDAVEGLFFHRAFDVIEGWCESLFNKVMKGDKWTDFQTLTSTFRDTVEEKEAGWMNPAAIRIRTVRSSGALVGPRALNVIRGDYEVPFPLSQLLSATSIELRAEVFTFILQLRMAQYLLSQTKVFDRVLLARSEGEPEIRTMWNVRQKLSWLLDTSYIWLTERIIEVENRDYRTKLSEMTSLRSMISSELDYARKIRNYAFQNQNTLEIYEHIQDIFDMTYTLSECYTSLVAQSATKPREDNVTTRRRHRPRSRPGPRQKRSRRHGSSDEEEENEGGPKEASISFIELSLEARTKRMSKDLDRLVHLIKDGVDDLSAGSKGHENDGWAILAFALEDWK